MIKYLELVQRILDNGTSKLPERKLEGGRKLDNGTIGLPNQVFSHDMKDGFPLITTRKAAIKSVCVELEGFIKGITSKKWYQERGCKFWDLWANPKEVEKFYRINYEEPHNRQREEDRKIGTMAFDSYFLPSLDSVKPYIQQSVDDLGPIYGYQWRQFDQQYGKVPTAKIRLEDDTFEEVPNFGRMNGTFVGNDQLANIVNTLKSHPDDRRMVCLAWNPNQLALQALPACHLGWNVTVYNNKLNLCWFQRSADLMAGVWANIASYAILLTLLAKHANLKPGNLTGILVDCHIYENQIENAKEQLKREPFTLPTIEIPNNDGDNFDFWKWNHTQISLKNYQYHPSLKMEVTI